MSFAEDKVPAPTPAPTPAPAPVPAKPAPPAPPAAVSTKAVVPTPGQWVNFEYGQYTLASTGTGNNNIIMSFSTWDPILNIPGISYVLSKEIQQKDVDRTAKAYKISAAIALIPGVTDIAVSKHRVDVQRAFVYSWESILPQVLEAFRKSDLTKQGG
jgi:hypothetical protein